MGANAHAESMALRGAAAEGSAREFPFRNLVPPAAASVAGRRTLTVVLSISVHAIFLAAVLVAPLLLTDSLPVPVDTVRAFFAEPLVVAPPSPPPPPPPPATRLAVKKPPVVRRVQPPAKLVAPVEIPEFPVPPEESLDLGIEGGVPGGVEGGVPGGVVGGIIGGLPEARVAPPPPPRVVRVGGQLVAPELLHKVDPEYPPLAQAARVSGVIVLEAHVGTNGRVKSVKVLRGQPLLDEAAVSAVKQWRYRPLLLNGVPTEFILTVTVNFSLR